MTELLFADRIAHRHKISTSTSTQLLLEL